MINALVEAFWDSLAALPWLVVIYLAFEFLERRYEGRLKDFVARARGFGPLAGALLGCVPQCGFSMVASALYCHRSISLGTLLAVYLSTSDEAVPVILAQPDKIGVLAPLLMSKMLVAMVAGFAVDLLGVRLHRVPPAAHAVGCACVEETHCCGRRHDGTTPSWKDLFITPSVHALRIFCFILVASCALNLLVQGLGEARLTALLLGDSLLQPLLATVVGLIPNCAASVVITQVFLKGGISFGSAVAGLCASAGLGLIVLVKEAPSTQEACRIIGLLAGVSFLAGVLINLVA